MVIMDVVRDCVITTAATIDQRGKSATRARCLQRSPNECSQKSAGEMSSEMVTEPDVRRKLSLSAGTPSSRIMRTAFSWLRAPRVYTSAPFLSPSQSNVLFRK